jgi:hypothetical protein
MMNCCNCGEEIREPSGYICEKCLAEIQNFEPKEGESISPEDAIRLMLAGKPVIVTGDFDYPCWYDREKKMFFQKDSQREVCYFSVFHGPFKYGKKNRPWNAFECLVWANSEESRGWMVRRKYIGDGVWGQWDISQRLRYDTQEEFLYPDVVEYQRAMVLPDKSAINESTIQGFVTEE